MSERRQIRVTGRVQGVGFRAFVRALALDLGLTGFVRNDGRDVFLEAQGDPVQLEKLLSRLQNRSPPRRPDRDRRIRDDSAHEHCRFQHSAHSIDA